MAAPAAAPPWLHDADLAAQKYSEAVAVAVEKCARDTAGRTCYICKGYTGTLVRGCACRGTAGFAHVSCLAEQAKILVAEAEENNLGLDALNERLRRWDACSLCEQDYHGVVACALGWAAWKTYVGRPEADRVRFIATNLLGNGLSEAGHDDDALSVQEAGLAMMRRIGRPVENILAVQTNLSNTYQRLGRPEEALRMKRDVYSGRLRLNGEENQSTLRAALNYASSLSELQRFEEAKALLRKTLPVARRVLGGKDRLTLKMRWTYAQSLYLDAGATLDDLREAVTTLEDVEQTARRVLGGANPNTVRIEKSLRNARAALAAREATPPPRSA